MNIIQIKENVNEKEIKHFAIEQSSLCTEGEQSEKLKEFINSNEKFFPVHSVQLSDHVELQFLIVRIGKNFFIALNFRPKFQKEFYFLDAEINSNKYYNLQKDGSWKNLMFIASKTSLFGVCQSGNIKIKLTAMPTPATMQRMKGISTIQMMDGEGYGSRDIELDTADFLKYARSFYKTVFDPNAPWEYVKDGCFVATCVYGNIQNPNVKLLRQFRDQVLQKHCLGELFIDWYYRHGPKMASWCEENTWIKKPIRFALDIITSSIRKLIPWH
jgi:hypothetical protein